jgi:hypothetical protein
MANGTEVALVVSMVDWIKANLRSSFSQINAYEKFGTDDGHEESDIGFGQTIPDKVVLPFQELFDFV